MPKRARRPVTPRTRSARTLRGAPQLPRASRGAQARPWDSVPLWFRRAHPPGYRTEWAIFYDLVRIRKFREGDDFLYQKRIPVAGLNRTETYRPDFWILPTGRNGSPGPAFSRGIIVNPIGAIGHPDINKDRRERAILGAQHYLEIYIDEQQVLADPHYYVGEALRGLDHSSRKG